MGFRVGRVSLTAAVLWSLACFAGCASIAGLDGITENSCAPNCGTDSSVVVESGSGGETGADTAVQNDTGPGSDTSMTEDSSSGGDTGMPADSGMQDTFVLDTSIPYDGPPWSDAPFDSGCGDLNTTTNCSACGDTCAATSGAGVHQTQASCPGSTNGMGAYCHYTCATGFLDCNAATMPPDLDGCECTAPSTAPCCGGACPTGHITGLVPGQKPYYPTDQNFYDCDTTMNLQLATDACTAYVTARGGTAAANCGAFGPVDGGPPDSVCAITAINCGSSCMGFMGDCICWTVSGTYAGQVIDPVALGLDAQCYTGSSSLSWH